MVSLSRLTFFFMYDGLHALILLLPNNVVVRVHLLTPTTLGLGFWVWATFLFLPCHFIALKEEATYLLLLPAGFSLNVPRTWRGAAWTEQATRIYFVGLQGTLAWLFDVCGRRHHLELTVLRIVMTSNPSMVASIWSLNWVAACKKCTISPHYCLLSAFASCPSSSIPECLLLYVSSRRFHLLLAPAESKRLATEARRATPTAGTCCTDHAEPQLKRNEKQSPLLRFFNRGCLLHYHFSRAATASVAEICTHKHSEETAGGPIPCDTLAPVMPLRICAGAGSMLWRALVFQ